MVLFQDEPCGKRLMDSNLQGSEPLLRKECVWSHNTIDAKVRMCSSCNATKTPLWRSGPRGPKSLCNACGMRRMRARKATEASSLVVDQKINMEKEMETCEGNVQEPGSTTARFNERYGCTAMRGHPGGSVGQQCSPVHSQEVRDAATLLMRLSSDFVLE